MTADTNNTGWFKSSYSQHGGDCVEVAHLADAVGVRDSKNPAGPALEFAPEAWDSFIQAVTYSK